MTQSGKAFAEALYALAMEEKQEKVYLEALEAVGKQLDDAPAYVDFLASPGIPKKERTDALAEAFAHDVPTHVLSFLQLLCEKGAIHQFDRCVEEYRALFEAATALTPASVISAVKLTEEQQDRLRRRLEDLCGGTVQLTCTVDETLLGGMTVYVDGKVLDGSMKRRLREIKEVMHQ